MIQIVRPSKIIKKIEAAEARAEADAVTTPYLNAAAALLRRCYVTLLQRKVLEVFKKRSFDDDDRRALYHNCV